MTSAEKDSRPRELFKDLSQRMAAMGVPVGVLIRAAAAEQAQGDDGAFVELEPDEYGPGAIITVTSEVVTFRVGGEGYDLPLEEVKEMSEPQHPQENPSYDSQT